MKTKFTKIIGAFAFISGATTFCLPVTQAEKMLDYPTSVEGIKLEIHAKTLPIFPHTLKVEGYSRGEVELIVEIDEFGELRDYLVSFASRDEFAREIERVIDTWDFNPPMWEGKAVPVIARIRVNFESTGAVVSFDITTGFLNKIVSQDILMQIHRLQNLVDVDDLDSFPTPKIVANPQISQELLDENKGTKGIFTFYIDQKGRVRMPAIEQVEGDVDLRLLIAVQDALLQWQFEPPTVKGKPVIVHVSQPFLFNG